jgi:hypothetical protein
MAVHLDMHTFGCVCFVHLSSHERNKLSAQFVRCAFMGYIFLTKVTFAMIHALIDFINLIMLFSLKINIYFPLMLHMSLIYMFFHTLMTRLLLLNDLILDLCINDDTQLCLFLSPTCHLSLFTRCLPRLSWILALFLVVLLDSLVLLIGMDFLIYSNFCMLF